MIYFYATLGLNHNSVNTQVSPVANQKKNGTITNRVLKYLKSR